MPPDDPDASPAGLSTFATIGLLILAIGGLAAVSAWLWAWYRGREAVVVEPDGPDDPDGPAGGGADDPTVDPGDPGEPTDPGEPAQPDIDPADPTAGPDDPTARTSLG